MSCTKRLLIEEAWEGRRVCDALVADYHSRRGDKIPSDIDYKLAHKLDLQYNNLTRVEQQAMHVVMTAYICSFPIPKPVYHNFENACYRVLVFSRHDRNRKEKGGGSSEQWQRKSHVNNN